MSRLFTAAADLEPQARDAYLREHCPHDSTLRATVESMLAAHDQAGSFGEQSLLATSPHPKRLKPGSEIGPFRIDSLLGAGGMGEVYRARDTKLQRDVAIKVLPDSLADDADRRARLAREARALASLNHPHIGAIYGLEERGDLAALVLELVEGPTLAERLEGGPLSSDEIAASARQTAEALEAAHDRGIIHRDLKPANIKITPDGDVKVLDFGLAKAIVDPPGSTPTGEETATRRTHVGIVVGTATYMSPEQARGRPVDKRTDIWAFGCVLFEMCAGRPPFGGETVGDTLAAVIEREPDWSALPQQTPPHIVRLLRRCLTKDVKLRLRDIGEARIALAAGTDEHVAEVQPPQAQRRWVSAAMVGALVLAAVAIVGLLTDRDQAGPFQGQPIRFPIPPPDNGTFVINPSRMFFALSPDASQVAFVAYTDRVRVWLRSMSELNARPVEGTDDATSVFWSPDGRSLAFFVRGQLKRIDLPGGSAVKICDLPGATALMHGTWSVDGTILVGSSQGRHVFRVPASGGTPQSILSPNPAEGEQRVHWPWFLPDGRRFLYTARLEKGEGELRIGQLDGSSRAVMPVASNAQWVDPDIVVFVRDSVLMGQRVDLGAARPVGEPFTVANNVEYLLPSSRAMFSTSRNGALVYHVGGDVKELSWADEKGNRLGAVSVAADYEWQSTRLSPKGDALLVSRRQPGPGTYDIYRIDLVRNTDEQITHDRGADVTPIWLNEREIVFAGDRSGAVPFLFRKDLVSGVEQPLLPPGLQQLAMDVFPGNQKVAYIQRSPDGIFDIYQLALTAGAKPEPLVVSPFEKIDLRLSPDGRAIAYTAVEGSRTQLYVTGVPVVTPPTLAVANVGGSPRWSADGKYVYYVGDNRRVMRLGVTTAPSLTVGASHPLFELKPSATLFDVARDGRFLLVELKVRSGHRPLTMVTDAFGSTER